MSPSKFKLCLCAIISISLFIFLFSPFGGCSPAVCEGDHSKLKIDPNGGICTKRCECNNLLYEGACLKGKCVAFLREPCLTAGETKACKIRLAIHKCTDGVKTCGEAGAQIGKWGDCICLKGSAEKATEPPPEKATEPTVEKTPEVVAEDAGAPTEKVITPEPIGEKGTHPEKPVPKGLHLSSGGIGVSGSRAKEQSKFVVRKDGLEYANRICSKTICVSGGIQP